MRTILVLTDFSEKAEHAAQMAVQIALAAHAQVILLTAFNAPQVYPSDAGIYPYYEDYTEEEKVANNNLKALAERLLETVVGETLPSISYRSRPGCLNDSIEGLDPWLIVMGGKSKDSALSHFIFGSASSAIMDIAPCPVLIVPEPADVKAFSRIVFASDLQPSEKEALRFVEEFGAIWNASIMVLHVSLLNQIENVWDDQYDYCKEIISDIHPTVRYADVRGSDIAGAINIYAGREAIDLIAIAHKKRTFIGQLLHKSIGKNMLNYDRVPVLILHKS